MSLIQAIMEKFKNITREDIIDILISAILIILFFMISRITSYVIIKVFNFKKSKKKIKANAFYNPLCNLIRITGIYVAIMMLHVPDNAKVLIVKYYRIGIIICIANGIAKSFHPKSKIFNKLEQKTSYKGDRQLNNFVSKIIKAIIYFIAGYLIMLELGYNLGGLVTGLGISSVIVAFAAQDIAKNLFGGFAIILDKPFKVGDWIEVGEYSGTVVDITFRSTKIEAVDSTIITINNATITESYVTNWGDINKRRYTEMLNIPLQTPQTTVKKLMKKIEFVLKTNPNVIEDSLHVHFEDINTEGIKIFVGLNTTITDYDEFRDFKDVINLELLKVLESENVKLSYPGQNIYVKEADEQNKKSVASQEPKLKEKK